MGEPEEGKLEEDNKGAPMNEGHLEFVFTRLSLGLQSFQGHFSFPSTDRLGVFVPLTPRKTQDV